VVSDPAGQTCFHPIADTRRIVFVQGFGVHPPQLHPREQDIPGSIFFMMRRAIYGKQVPFQIATLLDSFDYPQMTPNCLERGKSNVATQALHLMNDSMIRKLADAFADRVALEGGDDRGRQIDTAYLIALSRPPTAEQKKISLDGLARLEKQWSHAISLPRNSRKQALSTYCHMILNSASFLYVD